MWGAISLKSWPINGLLPNRFVYNISPKLCGAREYTANIPSSGKPRWLLGMKAARSCPSAEISQLASLYILQFWTRTFTEAAKEKRIRVNDQGKDNRKSRHKSTPSYKRLQNLTFFLNGQYWDNIKLSRGAQQSCPLSRFIFNICLESLAIAIRSHHGIREVVMQKKKKLNWHYTWTMLLF